MTHRDRQITKIVFTAMQEASTQECGTTHDFIRLACTLCGIDFRLIEWHAGPDGVQRCILCGNTHAERHANDCAWFGFPHPVTF